MRGPGYLWPADIPTWLKVPGASNGVRSQWLPAEVGDVHLVGAPLSSAGTSPPNKPLRRLISND